MSKGKDISTPKDVAGAKRKMNQRSYRLMMTVESQPRRARALAVLVQSKAISKSRQRVLDQKDRASGYLFSASPHAPLKKTSRQLAEPHPAMRELPSPTSSLMADAPPPKEALKPLTQAPATPVASVKRFNPIVLTFILVPFISTLAFFFLPISSVPSSISKPSSLKVNLPRHVAFPGRDMISVKDKPFNPEEYEAKYGKVAKGCKAKDRSGWLGEKEIEIDIRTYMPTCD
jgi:hypothetical protein